jgi:hypothetical protein
MKVGRYLVIFVVFLMLFGGGLGISQKELVEIIAFLLGLLLFFFGVGKKKKKIPKGFLFYLVFLFFLAGSVILRSNAINSFEFLMLFASGAIYWFSFYNLKKFFFKDFYWLIFFLALAFGLSALVYQVFSLKGLTPWGLVSPYTKNHHHLGDFWVLIVLIVLWFMRKKVSWWHMIFLFLGFLVLAMSLSRSAYVALLVGAIFLAKKGHLLVNRLKTKIFLTVVLGVLILVLFTAFSKTTLFARPYFIQGLIGLFHNPLGVGMGNFGKISADPANHIWGFSGFSNVAHNIILEVVSGIGIFSVPFLIWFYLIIKDILLKDKSDLTLLYSSLFLALGVNFLFDSTYLIPTMLILWFMLLGLIQKDCA